MKEKCQQVTNLSSNKTTINPKGKLAVVVDADDYDDDDNWMGLGALCHNSSASPVGKLAAV